MATPKAAWGMEIGADAIKAIRLEREGDSVSVSDFAVIPHKKVLTTPDLDQDEMIRLSLGQFISQKSLEGEHLVMSVPGHAAFARFAKLPPVEPKKVPDIVKFEAVQQIPFPIEEVEWDYQTFTSEDSPEIEVGIFAITRERVQQRLGLYAELGISPEAMTLSPVAVYNAMAHDLILSKSSGPLIFLDIGTQATDVIIAEQGRCWIRTFPLGGTHFTEAIANSFKLSYSKAEKLKKEASTSKYAKQIMQAMRPVFSDLLQDLQRSIGYYHSLHRDVELTEVIGLGSTFKIPGLRKFIGQQLQINVARLDEYKKISVAGREAASFAEHAVNMATAYGLALQGVGLSPIAANLVPVKALREQMWHAKTKWFAGAAAIIVVGAATTLIHPLSDRTDLAPGDAPQEVAQAIEVGNRLVKEFQQAQTAADVGFTGENMRRLTDYRKVWPYVVNDAATALSSTDPQPVLLEDDAAAIKAVDPKERRLVGLSELGGDYTYIIESKSRRIRVTMNVKLSHDDPIAFLNSSVAAWLRDNAEPVGDRADVPYRILVDSISCNPTARTDIEVTESGETTVKGGGATGTGGGMPGRRPPDVKRPPSGTAPPGPGTGPGPGAGTGPGMGGGGTGAGAPGRRKPPGGQRQAPGGGLGVGTGEGTAAPPPPSDPGAGSPFGGPPGGAGAPGRGAPDAPEDRVNLDELAPMPNEPSLFPVGSTYYLVPITFEIEILDPGRPPAPTDQTASNQASGGKEAGA